MESLETADKFDGSPGKSGGGRKTGAIHIMRRGKAERGTEASVKEAAKYWTKCAGCGEGRRMIRQVNRNREEMEKRLARAV